MNPLYDVWITVISSYLTDGFLSKNNNTALCLCCNRLTGPVPPLLWRGSEYPDRSELDRRLLSSTSSIRHQVINLRSLKMPFGKEDAYFVASLIAGQITLEKEPFGLFDGPGWLSYKLNTGLFFFFIKPLAINNNCTTATLPTMPFQKENAYFIASVLIGHMPIGRAIPWAFRRVQRTVRERPQGDEEALNAQERDEIKEGITVILQCL